MNSLAENRNFEHEIRLRIQPSRNTIIVETHRADGVIGYKEISPLDFYFAINESYSVRNVLSSGFLPDHCLHVSMDSHEQHLVFWNAELRADITYGEKEYLNFPLPRLVFAVRVIENGKLAECSLGVVADETPTPDTIMYHYPFSNVYPDSKVCVGNNVLPRYKKLTALKNFPRYLLGLPDNDDFFKPENNRPGLGHGELLELLQDKDPAYYYTDILVPNGKTLNDFIYGR